MDKTEFFKSTSILFLIAILFSPTSSKIWILFLSIGLIFGVAWFFRE
ncbi:hypothetical protein HYS72_02135 [Candidatus Pacearchaeota archaeon]|nr:hypothetical protein [Candidatus Pacearchaeota archaeon]